MIHSFKITIPTLLSAYERQGYIYIPDSYNDTTHTRYPVLYMFDGDSVFFDEDTDKISSLRMSTYLEHNPTDIIIIAIDCNHEGHSRLSEYTPFDFSHESVGHIKASGKKYMDWLVNTLKPAVDKQLRTLKDRKNTYLCGFSMGGLMSLYGAVTYNKYFAHAICMSPSIWVAPDKLYNMIKKSKMNRETSIYMDYGSKELKYLDNIQEVLLETTRLLLDKSTNATLRIIQGGTHSTASWSKQIPIIMKLLGF